MDQPNKVPNKLTKGSRYRVLSKGESTAAILSEGEFLGYVQFGQDSGLLLDLDPKEDRARLRIIPMANILYIDILVTKEEEEGKKKDVPLVSYG
jgi:hypothetical protein